MKKTLLTLFYAAFIVVHAVSQPPKRPVLADAPTTMWISTPRPNPASVTATFEYTLPSEVREARILIRNLTGLVEINQPLDVSATKQVIDVADLAQGLYLYSFEVDGRIILTRKLLISR